MSASFEEFLDSSLKTFRDQLLQAHAAHRPEALTPTPALTAKTPKPSSQLLLPLPRREPHCHRSLDTEMLLPIRPRSPVEEPLVDPIPEAACEAETKMQPPEEDLMVAPLDSSGSSRGSRGKRRSRRPSVQDDEKEGLQGLQDLQGLEPDVTPDADDTMTLEAQGRLQVRLGALDTLKLITGEELHDTTVALGLTSYSIEDMNQMLNTLADYIDLKFVTMESPKGKHRLGRGASGLFKHSTPPGPPSWEWPRPLPTRRISTIGRGSIQILEPNSRWNAIPFRALVEAFQRDEQELSRKVFTAPRMMVQFQAVKEILLAGDTNRLVAELTFVRINDLAAPPEKIDVLAYLEPLVFLTILGNGIMIGVQSDPEYYDWKGWWWMELVFALVLVAEFLLRLAVQGCYTHFRGPDRIWNLFDLLFITTAIVDLVLELVAQDSSVAIATLLRFARMARITRIMKVFRLHWMKELRLMVKGLVGGFRTLVTAMILLLAVLYVIAGLATYTLGRDPLTEELGYRPLFYNLPISMFTAFRCLSGSCDADDGAPMNSVLAQNFGLSFVVPYVISYMLVTMGIFNVILAVYVDITMRAAKEREATSVEQHARESLRIARTARELLKKFAAAEKAFQANHDPFQSSASMLDLTPASSHFTDQVMHGRLEISKELFLLVIQDHGVQELMDDLDLPPDRANLFEVIDADGSGTLRVSELVQGLLKVRGELKKSDVVATTLATQTLQQLIMELREEQTEFKETVLRNLRELVDR